MRASWIAESFPLTDWKSIIDSLDYEIWRDVVGHEGLYKVSSRGSVKSVDRRHWLVGRFPTPVKRKLVGKLIKPIVGKRGVQEVSLSRNGKYKAFKIHHLVLFAFVGPKPIGMECRHLNGKAWWNWLGNLQWGTSKENVGLGGDRDRHGMTPRGEKQWRARLMDSDIVEIRTVYAAGGISMMQLGKRYKINSGTVSDIVNRKAWKHVK